MSTPPSYLRKPSLGYKWILPEGENPNSLMAWKEVPIDPKQPEPAVKTSTGYEPRIAPVQGYVAGIPWAMHLRAYDAYCKRHGEQKAMITAGCRGGFHVVELDALIPGWREELSDRSADRAELAAQSDEIVKLNGLLDMDMKEKAALRNDLFRATEQLKAQKDQAKLGWERAAEKDAAYDGMITDRDNWKRKAENESYRSAGAEANLAALKTRVVILDKALRDCSAQSLAFSELFVEQKRRAETAEQQAAELKARVAELEEEVAVTNAALKYTVHLIKTADQQNKILRDALEGAKAAFIKYEIDVDDEPPYAHRQLMERITAALSPPSGGARE